MTMSFCNYEDGRSSCLPAFPQGRRSFGRYPCTEAERATRRALTGQQRMRPQAAALRALEADRVRATVTYLHRGRELATHCAQAQRRLALAGLPTAERDLPSWVMQILAAADLPGTEAQAKSAQSNG